MRLKSFTVSPIMAVTLVIGTISLMLSTTTTATANEPGSVTMSTITTNIQDGSSAENRVHGSVVEPDELNLGFQKMIGVDFRPDGHSRMEQHQQQQPQQQQQQIWSPSSSSSEDNQQQDRGMNALNINSQQKAEVLCINKNERDTCLLFSDEFDRLDNSVWKHDLTMTGGGNFEVQVYMNNRTNTFVRDGIFYIRPTLTENRIGLQAMRDGGVLDMWGNDPGTLCTGNYDYGCFRVAGAGGNILNPIQSGLVRSVNSFKFKFGKVVVRAKMPKGKWIWPAIWMLPAHYQYGGWPASGEIDLVEARGNGPEYAPGGVNKVASTLHWVRDQEKRGKD
ncbi:hypothetical protein BGZ83_006515 [Gryganskiella cystojenkinii]|nr:hypothetical protein BGZ83_006515 [Gryganskiella cystojenkinii]